MKCTDWCMFNNKLVSKASKSPNGIKPQLWEQDRSLCMHRGGVAVPWALIPIAAAIPRAEWAPVPWQWPCRTGPAPGSHSHVHPVPPVPQPQLHLGKGSLGQDRSETAAVWKASAWCCHRCLACKTSNPNTPSTFFMETLKVKDHRAGLLYPA